MFPKPHDDLSVSTSDLTGLRFLYVSEGDWSSRCDRLMKAERLDGISFGSGVQDPMGVLARYPELRLIWLPAASTDEIARLQEFAHLEDLYVVGARGRRTDDLRFPRLRAFAGAYHPSLAGVLANASLEHVNLSGPPGPDLTGWPELPQLRTLALGSGRKLLSLDGLERFPALEHLDVSYQPALHDFSALGLARSLTSIEIDGCRGLRDLEWVKLLPGLRSLQVHNCGDIESVAALRGHPGLETLILSESTKIVDGDTTPILEIPSLQSIGLRAYRHYEPPAEQIEDALYSRPGNTRPHQGDVIVRIFEEL